MILHSLPLTIESIVARAGKLTSTLAASPPPRANLPRAAEEDGRGGADAPEAKHGFRWWCWVATTMSWVRVCSRVVKEAEWLS